MWHCMYGLRHAAQTAPAVQAACCRSIVWLACFLQALLEARLPCVQYGALQATPASSSQNQHHEAPRHGGRALYAVHEQVRDGASDQVMQQPFVVYLCAAPFCLAASRQRTIVTAVLVSLKHLPHMCLSSHADLLPDW